MSVEKITRYEDLYYKELFDGSIEIVGGCEDDNGILEIPRYIDRKKVTVIGNYAFRGCKNITGIIIPDGITEIGNYAFHNCSELLSITFPDSVRSIGDCAFACCYNLASIIFSDNLTSIGDSAFAHCTSLTSITIPNSLTTMGGWVFAFCINLTSITIPDSVTSIGIGVFDCTMLKSKKSRYKVCRIVDGRFICCRDFEYKPGEWSEPIEYPKLRWNGYHYSENLFDVFNYYGGVLDDDIAVFECEVEGVSDETEKYDSKRVCSSLRLTKRLSKGEVIKLLNGSN